MYWDESRECIRITSYNVCYTKLLREPWSENMREEVEKKLGLKAIDIYGLSEIIGPGVSMECIEAQHGMHIFEDHFMPEIIDPDTGRVLPIRITSYNVCYTKLLRYLPQIDSCLYR